METLSLRYTTSKMPCLWLYLVSFLTYPMSKNVVTLKSGSKVTQGHWKWYHSTDCVWFPISVFLVTLSPIYTVFWDIRCARIQWPWNPVLGSLNWSSKMIPFDPAPMTFHSNHPRVFNALGEGVPLGIGYRPTGSKELQWWGYQIVEKVLIGLVFSRF